MEIPTTLGEAAREFLRRVARALPKGSVIVDVGAFYGATTALLAENAKEPARIYAVDTWEPKPWIREQFERKRQAPPFGPEAFRKFTNGVPNLHMLQMSAEQAWDRIEEDPDLVFLDFVTSAPLFEEVLQKAAERLKEGGFLCGDNYGIRAPDVVYAVDQLGRRWGMRPEVRGRLWALRKPRKGETTNPGVEAQLEPPDHPRIKVAAVCDFAPEHEAPPEVWAGRVGKSGALRGFRLEWDRPVEGLGIRYRCACAGKPSSPMKQAGEWCYADEMKSPIISVYMELTGERAADYRLGFQGAFVRDGRAPFKDKLNSPIVPGGKWLKAPTRKAPLSALRVIVRPRAKDDA